MQFTNAALFLLSTAFMAAAAPAPVSDVLMDRAAPQCPNIGSVGSVMVNHFPRP